MSSFYEKSVKEIADIEQPSIEFAERLGWYQCKFIAPGTKGVPDRFMARIDRGVWLVEFKAPGKEPTKQQLKRHRELREHGVNVIWFDSVVAACEFFR